jgi:hypothetical protein
VLTNFEVHSASVETYTGATPTGDGYSAAVTVPGLLDDGLVRLQGVNGEQLVQRTNFYARVEYADVFKPESRVTVNGRVGQVSRVRRREAGAMFGLVEHIEVELT